MHLLAATPGIFSDGSEAVDLGQTSGDIVILSAADTELTALSAGQSRAGADAPSLRLANFLQLTHPMSVDVYVAGIIAHAKLVVIRLLGGVTYWPYGVEQIAHICRRNDIRFAALPGEDTPDPELAQYGTVPSEDAHRLWQYLVHGGSANIDNFLGYAAHLLGIDSEWAEPVPLMTAGLYWPDTQMVDMSVLHRHWKKDAPVAAVTFYRALLQSGNTEPVDAMIAALQKRDLNPLPIYIQSLKESISAGVVEQTLCDVPPDVILNTTGFAVSTPGVERNRTPFDSADCPVLQTVFSATSEDVWAGSDAGLVARDIAMNVALPEVDGRVLTRAVAFKSEARFDAATQAAIVKHLPSLDRIDFVAELAAAWIRLARTPPPERRIALVLANYPNRDGRLGNGVGLDTPAGTITLLHAMKDSGYGISNLPNDGASLIARLLDGPTNHGVLARRVEETISIADYQFFFSGLPQTIRDAVSERWGAPESDPFYLDDAVGYGALAIPVFRLGKIAIGLQPARGYNIDPAKSYHDPDLVPPHSYFAFYAWIRLQFNADAVVHMGKHGNLEWLPGKSLALSVNCFPEAALGPLPNVYPFIVNDPGEGTQAKRRTSAVIVDHLTPPLARAETYGPLADLERLVDEYYEAAGLDPRRINLLRERILELTRSSGLDLDCGISVNEPADEALAKLDNYLCELKELQIRDGLHVFGISPEGSLRDALLVALVRLPRGDGQDGDASLIRALAADLGLEDFDPLDCLLGDPWTGPRPAALAGDDPWRTNGDTVERLEILALDLVGGRTPDDAWPATRVVIDTVRDTIAPSVAACGSAEISGVLAALDGRFVNPGPSGAPTRGRVEVLPTGRNFYSVDTRTVPTPTAWTLGWRSATLLIHRHAQEHGEWPRRMALSAWGTSNMRTGGDDIAQGLALMGVQPQWDRGSGRVTGFEIMPLEILDRPRVDVTLRLSGFFRDAFPQQINLFDSAARAVAALDEPLDQNPLAARVAEDAAALMTEGIDEDTARRRAGHRVFGSKSGAYGAGLQALIDERGWDTDADLARAYIAWGGYAYGEGAEGEPEHRLFERCLSGVEAVVHNQDNREHDLLDSDDYYQFEGGLTAAVRYLSGDQPAVWHNDHSRPETPKIRSLEDEIARVVRARVVNPKWIAGVMRHGYKGAFEMAATVDYLFAFAATAHCVKNHQFDLVFDAYLADPDVREFLERSNPHALRDMAERLIEAQDRGLWRPRSNTAWTYLRDLKGVA
ncbi:MAG: cobaltochelatase subunit CobN [Pelagibacteraceae bacterium]|nr:cobaltochelatase subunit CobN [Pelagibacteraceae bacterium]PPR10888.1 MAG: Aerobic cobaltochelatase subunit CobN [Alphaproteobacteria bacterium MarineAlpha11_Bin1]|tara:strand:- start:5192 stop:8932 length:3741 start_codon:yes stop_codon:yes gene_type:complete